MGVVDGDGDRLVGQWRAGAQGVDDVFQRQDLVAALNQIADVGVELFQSDVGAWRLRYAEAVVHQQYRGAAVGIACQRAANRCQNGHERERHDRGRAPQDYAEAVQWFFLVCS